MPKFGNESVPEVRLRRHGLLVTSLRNECLTSSLACLEGGKSGRRAETDLEDGRQTASGCDNPMRGSSCGRAGLEKEYIVLRLERESIALPEVDHVPISSYCNVKKTSD